MSEKQIDGFPLVHLNGTNANVLREQYLAILDGVNQAMNAVKFAAPNMRDYYLLNRPKECFDKSISDRNRWTERLESILSEVSQYIEAIDQQSEAA